MAWSGESWMTPPMSKTTARTPVTQLADGRASDVERDRAVGRLAQRDGRPQRAETVHPLQLLELQVLHLGSDIAEVMEVLEVAAVLQRLRRVRVDDRDPSRLRHALARALDERLVDALLDDLVAHVVGAVHVEALLVRPESDRQRRVLDEHEVRDLER